MVKIIKEIWPYIVGLIVVIVLKAFIMSPIRVNGPSMEKTLHSKDIMILDKLSYRFSDIKRFDIVVVRLDDEDIIKRVIGLPGETIEYKDNKLYVNDKEIKENFSHKKTQDYSIRDLNSKKIPENTYFVMGDNRTNSIDSRVLGFIPKSRILGHATFTVLPFSRFGNKD